MIDRVKRLERPAVLAHVEGELHRQFGIERPHVAPSCMLLAEAPHRLTDPALDERQREGFRDDIEDALLSLGQDALLPPEEAVAHSGLPAIRDFLDRVRAEKRLWKTRSTLEYADALVRGFRSAAELERSAIGQTAERVSAVREQLARALDENRQQLVVELGRLRADAVGKIDAAASAPSLRAEWHGVAARFSGDREWLKRELERSTREFTTSAAGRMKAALEEFQVTGASRAQMLLSALRDSAQRELEVSASRNVDVEGELAAEHLRLEVDWSKIRSGSASEGVSFELAQMLFATADSFKFGKGFFEDLGSAVLAAASAVAGVAMTPVGVVCRIVSGIFDWLFGGPKEKRDPHEEARERIKAQLTDEKARAAVDPLGDQGRRHADHVYRSILEAFDEKAKGLLHNLDEAQRRVGEDPASLRERNALLARALAGADRLHTQVAELRAML
jgi:hypothetical protein